MFSTLSRKVALETRDSARSHGLALPIQSSRLIRRSYTFREIAIQILREFLKTAKRPRRIEESRYKKRKKGKKKRNGKQRVSKRCIEGRGRKRRRSRWRKQTRGAQRCYAEKRNDSFCVFIVRRRFVSGRLSSSGIARYLVVFFVANKGWCDFCDIL